eukprot:1351-Heterococcus_DN1.PRE.5
MPREAKNAADTCAPLPPPQIVTCRLRHAQSHSARLRRDAADRLCSRCAHAAVMPLRRPQSI